jgi:hypothetical protein
VLGTQLGSGSGTGQHGQRPWGRDGLGTQRWRRVTPQDAAQGTITTLDKGSSIPALILHRVSC